jgi:hypothetical protein
MRLLGGGWLWAVAAAWPAWAAAGALDAPRQELLGARAAGMGGVEVAASPSLEALLYNPAGLPEASVQAGALAAWDAPRGDRRAWR